MPNNKIRQIEIDNTLYDIAGGGVDVEVENHVMEIGNSDSVEKVYGTCTTGASTAAKVVTSLSNSFLLETGIVIKVLFTNANTATNPTLNIDNSGAKSIKYTSSNTPTVWWKAGEVVEFTYDGTQYLMSPTQGMVEGLNTANIASITRSGTTFTAKNSAGTQLFTFTQQDNNTTKGDGITTKVAKTGTGTTVTSTITANTTMDDSIGTLLNNDVALKSALFDLTSYQESATVSLVTGIGTYDIPLTQSGSVLGIVGVGIASNATDAYISGFYISGTNARLRIYSATARSSITISANVLYKS